MVQAQLMANAIRILSIDAVEQAQSGHPGMPLGMADIAQVLWCEVLQHQPQDPSWFNRDRVVLSNGHGSMLQYAALFLRGYPLELSDLKAFRQLHSKTPGHPELAIELGIETTTGPLGQGLANAVGMAMAERILAEQYNRPGFDLIDHNTYALVGDGCLMEGISHEVASLAGTLGLGRLMVLWDDNGISIDGAVSGWCHDDVPARFEAYGWQVIGDVDGHDAEHIRLALSSAKACAEKPTLICCQTQIGFGAPGVVGQAQAHGAPLGAAEVAAVRTQLSWPSQVPFEVPEAILEAWQQANPGEEKYESWQQMWLSYRLAHPVLAKDYTRVMAGVVPDMFARTLLQSLPKFKDMATRQSSGLVLAQLSKLLPELVGGSADLTASNCTDWPQMQVYQPGQPGRYIHYGVREFGMFAIMNGLALHGGLRPFGGTFLTFSDYGRNAIRLAAMMQLPVVYVLSHDSVALGEDGPTHQPIEHIASLRAMPGLDVWRPCDGLETACAWAQAIETGRPSCLLLSRQTLLQMPDAQQRQMAIARGGYVLFDPPKPPEGLIIATGSEVSLAYQAAQALLEKGVHVRVVSMPCMEVFLRQNQAWQDQVLPPQTTKRLSIEAGVSQGWHRFVSSEGRILAIDCFGHSAPGAVVMSEFDLTVPKVIAELERLFQVVPQGV